MIVKSLFSGNMMENAQFLSQKTYNDPDRY